MSVGNINSYGLYIPYDKFLIRCGGKQNVKKILNSLTAIEKISYGKPKGSAIIVRHGYMYKNDQIVLPRIKSSVFLKHKIIDSISDNNDYTYRECILNEITMPLYDYQQEILNYLLKKYNDSSQKICYLQMDTGLGKTRVGCALVNELKCPALIVVPTIAIGYQWIDEFIELYPIMKTGFYHNNCKIGPDKYDIVVIVVNTFCKKEPNFVNGYGIIIYDEAHEYYTLCNSKVLWLAQTKYVLGLSATPLDRPDELDKYVTFHLGNPVLAKDISNISSVKFTAKVKCINYHSDQCENIITNKGTMSSILTIGKLIQDPDRIKLIINEIRRLYIEGHGIFVFAEHRDFLNILKQHLLDLSVSTETDLNDSDASIFKGGIHNSVVQNAKVMSKIKSHVILTTYGYSRRGISLTEMTALIMATPRRNGIKQIIGRILRRGSDESIVRNIIDIVDIRCNLRSQYFDRKKIYTQKGYSIETIKVESNTETVEDSESDTELLDISEINNLISNIYDSE